MESKNYLSVTEAESYTGIPRVTLYKMLQAGKIQKHPGASKILLKREELDKLVAVRNGIECY